MKKKPESVSPVKRPAPVKKELLTVKTNREQNFASPETADPILTKNVIKTRH